MRKRREVRIGERAIFATNKGVLARRHGDAQCVVVHVVAAQEVEPTACQGVIRNAKQYKSDDAAEPFHDAMLADRLPSASGYAYAMLIVA